MLKDETYNIWYTMLKRIRKSLSLRFSFFLTYSRKFGLVPSILLFWKLYINMLRIRINTTDREVFAQVFIRKDYDLGFLNLHPGTIIDGGANVGYASIFFAITYPQAKIFAVEPEESNFEMLLRNVRYYRNIIPIRAALWHREEELQILDASAEKWAFQTVKSTKEKSPESITALTVDKLMDLGKIDSIDIFKIDVEGAEKELFSANYEKWLEKTNVIIIELHDNFREGCTEELNNATKSFKFSRRERKDLLILFKTVKNS